MNERVVRIKESILKDEERVRKLQDSIKIKHEKIKEIENSELINNLNSISSKDFAVNDIVVAIKNKDFDSLLSLMETGKQEQSNQKSGSNSVLQIKKEATTNE